MALCAYSSPRRPALIAYDYQDGSVLWTSPMEDLQGFPGRIPGGIVMASMKVAGKPPKNYVFAVNPAEFVAYDAEGKRLWKRANNQVVIEAPQGIGLPVSLSFNDSKELVCATTGGWVVKLSPIDGHTIDAYYMSTSVDVEGQLHRGAFFTWKSPIVIGDVMYVLAEFAPDVYGSLPHLISPVHIIRIELVQRGAAGRSQKIKPLSQPTRVGDRCSDRVLIGLNRGRGSPPACVAPDGRVLIFAPAHALRDGRLFPTVAGVEDEGGMLTRRWLSVLEVPRGDSVHSAPALHGRSGSLFVTTSRNIFLFRDVRSLEGSVPSPQPIASEKMVSFATSPRVARVAVGSPFAVTFDGDRDDIVAYTNFRAVSNAGQSYSFLGAFSVPASGPVRPRPLWNRPLAITLAGSPAPGPGTVGQVALFRYDGEAGRSTGLIVNTVFTGTYIMK